VVTARCCCRGGRQGDQHTIVGDMLWRPQMSWRRCRDGVGQWAMSKLGDGAAAAGRGWAGRERMSTGKMGADGGERNAGLERVQQRFFCTGCAKGAQNREQREDVVFGAGSGSRLAARAVTAASAQQRMMDGGRCEVETGSRVRARQCPPSSRPPSSERIASSQMRHARPSPVRLCLVAITATIPHSPVPVSVSVCLPT
jgi:hypothetical protein